MALTKVSYSIIQGAPVNILDFGADPTGTNDSTSAIEAAQQSSKIVYCPPGTYKVTGLRIYDQVNLFGAGYENTIFTQGDPDQPAINCLSDATVGQLLSIRLENFGVEGHASATVAAVKIEALGIYAIYRSHFDMVIQNSYQALDMQAITANNVFYCTFVINVVATQTTSVVLNGGVYNTYDFFISSPGNGRAIEHTGFNNTFTRLVTEGQIVCSGQNTVFINPTIEQLPVAPPTAIGIVLNGFNQTLITPTIILNATNSTKINYCIQTFFGSTIINPNFLVTGTSNPFNSSAYTFTIQGPCRSGCVNKMEAVFDGSDDTKNLRTVTFVGDCSALTQNSVTHGGKSVQYSAPTGSANIQIYDNTDAMIVDAAFVIPAINFTIGVSGQDSYVNGQTISVWTKSAITATTFSTSVSGTDMSLFPTTMAADQKISYVYASVTNKWYPI